LKIREEISALIGILLLSRAFVLANHCIGEAFVSKEKKWGRNPSGPYALNAIADVAYFLMSKREKLQESGEIKIIHSVVVTCAPKAKRVWKLCIIRIALPNR
jgi:hypothetical protein